MRKCRTNHSYKYLPYATILAATQGDPEAIAAVLIRYKGYIVKLSTRYHHDGDGGIHIFVDEALRRRLEMKLITGILAFNAA